jgi:hypothetical protein
MGPDGTACAGRNGQREHPRALGRPFPAGSRRPRPALRLFFEVDNYTDESVLIAAKLESTPGSSSGRRGTPTTEKLMWRTRWSAPPSEEYERVHPPTLLGFHQSGRQRWTCYANTAGPAGPGLAAVAGVDADRGAALQTVVVEGVGAAVSSSSVQPSKLTL